MMIDYGQFSFFDFTVHGFFIIKILRFDSGLKNNDHSMHVFDLVYRRRFFLILFSKFQVWGFP